MKLLYCLGLIVILSSCSTKKEILYLQDAQKYSKGDVVYNSPTIQPNDILKISVETLVPEAALAYNKGSVGNTSVGTSLEIMQLEGYLVSPKMSINFPVLGEINVEGLTTSQLENYLKQQLEQGHLVNPNVSVRLLNAKVTIMGQVTRPGTYSFTEQNISILQALGYAGDLTINGKRDDILVIREIDGVRTISHLDLTSAKILDSPFYFIKPNDVIIVHPNTTKVKSAGLVGSAGTVLTIASLVLSSIILLTR